MPFGKVIRRERLNPTKWKYAVIVISYLTPDIHRITDS